MDKVKMLNLNIGVLGHVDSGKTSLAKVLSTVSSTACFDKNPQSQARGITIDLGFSSFVVDKPTKGNDLLQWDKVQFTLVDCPGHASLIRTVIGGAQIIDMVMLVIDVTKGMQTQTAECLIIAEITCEKMIIVLNKVDALPEATRLAVIEKMTKKIKLTLSNTVFKAAPIVSVAANPGGADSSVCDPIGIQELIETLREFAFIPRRDVETPFLYCVDHCFSIRGQGTVMTGTVLQGVVKINDVVEIPAIRVSKKVKSIQMFRQPIEQAIAGDRLGLCVTQFDPKLLERGIVCAPGYASTILAAIISIKKIKYFKGNVSTNARFHISIGHETIMAKITVFSGTVEDINLNDDMFNFDIEYMYQYDLLSSEDEEDRSCTQYALLEFEKPLLAVPKTLVIGSKLDIGIHSNTCRLAFSGRLLYGIEDKNYISSVLPNLKVCRIKCKTGVVERLVNEHEVIVKNLFKKETNVQLFVGLNVQLSSGEFGAIQGSFGQSGKVKIRMQDAMAESTLLQLSYCLKKKGKTLETDPGNPGSDFVRVMLIFKRYIYDAKKKIIQD